MFFSNRTEPMTGERDSGSYFMFLFSGREARFSIVAAQKREVKRPLGDISKVGKRLHVCQGFLMFSSKE